MAKAPYTIVLHDGGKEIAQYGTSARKSRAAKDYAEYVRIYGKDAVKVTQFGVDVTEELTDAS